MHIVLCGSMSAAQSLLDVRDRLVMAHHTVTLPENVNAYVGSDVPEHAREKRQLDVFKKYFAQIGLCDAIVVVNEDKGEKKNHIGSNTLIEMAFAHVLGKKIYLLHDVPKNDAYDEIVAMQPTVLHGSFEQFQ